MTTEHGRGPEQPTAGEPSRSPSAVSIFSAMGGYRGLLDSVVPTVVFVPLYALSGLNVAIWAALAAGAALFAARLARRETLQHAVAGFVVVAIAALLVRLTGRPEAFFLPKLLINSGYALAYAVSILIRWPLLGVVLGPFLGEGFGWRDDPGRLRRYSLASALWVGMFLLRLTVQVPLFLNEQLVALGIAHVLMSWPLFLVVAWLSWLIIREPGSRPAPASAPASPRR